MNLYLITGHYDGKTYAMVFAAADKSHLEIQLRRFEWSAIEPAFIPLSAGGEVTIRRTYFANITQIRHIGTALPGSRPGLVERVNV